MDDILKYYVSRNEEEMAWDRVEEEVFIIVTEEKKDKLLRLNKTAAYLWENFDGSKTVQELIDELCHRFEVNAEQALNDTINFITQMKNLKLLTVSQSHL
jgi:hypothetical protein